MKQSIGSIPLYNIIIVFIVITFGFLMATLSYVRAFKVNSKIAYSIEKFEGYNTLADEDIFKNLTTIGYRVGDNNCPSRVHFENGAAKIYQAEPAQGSKGHQFCVYKYGKKNGYVTYGIVTYIFIDIPIFGGKFKVPVYSETETIFEFSA